MKYTKFRVWDKQLEEMGQEFHKIICAEDGTEFNCISFKFGRGICFTLHDCINSSRFIVLQYTSIEDNNGKKIYEGDILTCDGIKERAVVEFYRGCFFAKGTPCCDWDEDMLEVIGNIYENPGLIKC